jgi:pyridoxamine 5'-phosphate oxidase
MTDPLTQFNAWFHDAQHCGLEEPTAMALATADAQGRPSVRMVLLKHADERGFVFYTNVESAKGRELMANPKACLCFHWKSLRRQVRIRGIAEPVSAAEADAYYASRPMGSRIGAWASQQSRPLASRAELIDAVAHFEREFEGINPARPRYWSGYRIIPLEIEFWADRPYRLHDRVSFARETTDMPWKKTRLYP